MQDKNYTPVQVDWYTRLCLTTIAVLLTLLIVGLWAENFSLTDDAVAKGTKYRDDKAKAAISEGRWGTSSAPGKLAAVQKETNDKLDELITLFKTGKAKVLVTNQPGQPPTEVKNVPSQKK